MGLMLFIVAGLVVGAIARLLRPGVQALGLVATLVISVVISLFVLGDRDIADLNLVGIAVGLIAAVLAIGVVESVKSGQRP